MTQQMKIRVGIAVFFVCTAAAHAPQVIAASPDTAGTVAFVEGNVQSVTGSAAPVVLMTGAAVHSGDTIRTGALGEVHLQMSDGGLIALRAKTTFRIDSYAVQGETTDSEVFSLVAGAIRSISGWIGKLNPSGYRLQTPTATIGIRGTDHETVYISAENAAPDETPGTYDTVNSGGTSVRTSGGTIDVAKGQTGHVPQGIQSGPKLLATLPAFLARRRTHNEGRVSAYATRIRHHIEDRLQARGLLKAGEHMHDYIHRKHQDGKPRRAVRNHAHPIAPTESRSGRHNQLRADHHPRTPRRRQSN